MGSLNHLPNGQFLLNGIMLTRERLEAGSKVAIPLSVLKAILVAAASSLPFDEPLLPVRHILIFGTHMRRGHIDLRTHFIESGYFEGRIGSKPDVNEQFYKETYPDVANAIANGDVESAFDTCERAPSRDVLQTYGHGKHEALADIAGQR